jgi:hypothetical protein
MDWVGGEELRHGAPTFKAILAELGELIVSRF